MAKDAVVTLRIPLELKVALEQLAESDMRSLTNLMTKALTDFAVREGALKRGTPSASRNKGSMRK